jgi:putative tryptophan/tyrosine transport system substrate-binding protein
MDRRAFLATMTGSLLAAPLGAQAQRADRVARIGYLALGPPASGAELDDAFRQALRDLGYVEGRNVVIEYRSAQGNQESLRSLAVELVSLKVDIIVSTGGTLAARAARQATTTIPIVVTAVGDPVAEGLVTSLARPGGNVTGLSILNFRLVGKRMELLKEVVPGVRRIAFLLKPDVFADRVRKDLLKTADDAAQALGVRLQVVEARRPEDFDRAFSDMTGAGVNALIVLDTPVFNVARQRLVDLTARHRLPTVFLLRSFVDAGGLMSYGHR